MPYDRSVTTLSLLLLLAGCGGGGGAGDAGPGADAPEAPGPVAVYQPPATRTGAPWGIIPFPNDLYLDAEGMLALTTLPVADTASPDAVASLLEALGTMDGAGLWSNVYIPVEGEIDPDTLAGNVVLLDLDDGGAELPIDVIWREDLGAIVASPRWGTSLLQKRRYAAYVTAAVTDPAGAPLRQAPAFLAAIADGPEPADPSAAAARTSLEPLLDVLDPGVRVYLASATVFRTQSVADTALAMREVVAATAPAISIDAVYGPGETGADGLQVIFGDQAADAPAGVLHGEPRAQPHGNVAVVLHGTIDLANFLSDTPGVDGLHELDPEGEPVVKGRHPVPFTLFLPDVASYVDLPVAIYIHGVNRTRADAYTQADNVAAQGMALLSFDLAYHGSRGPNAPDAGNDITGGEVPDGVGDDQGLFPAVRFFHLVESGGIPAYSPLAMEANLRQAAIEIVGVVEYLADGDTAAIEAALAGLGNLPDAVSFRDDVGILTESFGAMVSSVAIAIEPRIRVAVLSAPAGGFPFPSMLHSPNYADTFIGAITNPYGIGDRVVLGDPVLGARWEPIIMLTNAIIERGEASGFAPYLVSGELYGGPGPSVLIAMAWSDEWVSNDTTERLAAVAGVPHVTTTAPEAPPDAIRYVTLPEVTAPVSGNLGGGQTAGLTVWHPSTHASLRKRTDLTRFVPGFPPFEERPEPLIIDTAFDAMVAQWTSFLGDFSAGSAPGIVDPY